MFTTDTCQPAKISKFFFSRHRFFLWLLLFRNKLCPSFDHDKSRAVWGLELGWEADRCANVRIWAVTTLLYYDRHKNKMHKDRYLTQSFIDPSVQSVTLNLHFTEKSLEEYMCSTNNFVRKNRLAPSVCTPLLSLLSLLSLVPYNTAHWRRSPRESSTYKEISFCTTVHYP